MKDPIKELMHDYMVWSRIHKGSFQDYVEWYIDRHQAELTFLKELE